MTDHEPGSSDAAAPEHPQSASGSTMCDAHQANRVIRAGPREPQRGLTTAAGGRNRRSGRGCGGRAPHCATGWLSLEIPSNGSPPRSITRGHAVGRWRHRSGRVPHGLPQRRVARRGKPDSPAGDALAGGRTKGLWPARRSPFLTCPPRSLCRSWRRPRLGPPTQRETFQRTLPALVKHLPVRNKGLLATC